MIKAVKILSSRIEESTKRRFLKWLGIGDADVQTAYECSPYGIDSVPIKDMVAIHLDTTEKGKDVVVGYINKNQISDVGELRLFSTDDKGGEKCYTWLRSDGNLELNGDSDNAVRFSELKKSFDQLKADFNSHVSTYNTHTHPYVGLAVTVSGSTTPTTSVSSPSIVTIDAAKIDNVKTN